MNKKILVVDDEIKILDLVKNYLTKEGFFVITAETGEMAWELFQRENPDLVVLDLMMPGMSGYDICKKICALSTTPIIMLTAKSDEVDKLLGLELGADDYITKPFSLRELTARIRVILRRVSREKSADVTEEPEEILEYEDIRLDLPGRVATMKGHALTLTPTEYKILALLIKNPGVVFSRMQILEEVLGDYYEGYERSLDTHISNLRKKLGDDSANPHYIKTIYGTGYTMSKPR
jgi:two-component system OmpR family response regulator